MSDGGNIWPRITSAHTLSDVFFHARSLAIRCRYYYCCCCCCWNWCCDFVESRTYSVRQANDRPTNWRRFPVGLPVGRYLMKRAPEAGPSVISFTEEMTGSIMSAGSYLMCYSLTVRSPSWDKTPTRTKFIYLNIGGKAQKHLYAGKIGTMNIHAW